jgi:sphinganine C4-monooxygenase
MAVSWRLSVDDAVSAVAPFVVYWAYSGVHMALGHARVMDKYRLNTKAEEDTKNMVSKRAVLANVLLQHAMQLASVVLITVVLVRSQFH